MAGRKTDELYMRAAIEEAKKALGRGEVPIGAVVVRQDAVLSYGGNRREQGGNALLHAEIEAINGACRALGTWRLTGCELYVTLEPCPMCAGAAINSRIERVVYGACDSKSGACGSVINLFELPFNHRPYLTGGILEDECAELLTEFFKSLRNKN